MPQDQWIKDKTKEEYHKKDDLISYSRLSYAKKSAKAYKRYVIDGLRDDIEPTAAMQFGTLIHMRVLEPARYKKQTLVLPEFGHLRKTDTTTSEQAKKNKEHKAAFMEKIKPGKLLVTAEHNQVTAQMVKSLKADKAIWKVISKSDHEITGRFTDPRFGMECRMIVDIRTSDGALYDIKTYGKDDFNYHALQREIANRDYHMQAAFYLSGASVIDKKRRFDFSLIFAQTCEPFDTAMFKLDQDFLLMGRSDWMKAMSRVVAGMKTNKWPGIRSGNMHMPRYLASRAEEAAEQEGKK